MRIGVVGLGRWGSIWADVVSKSQHDLWGVDIDKERRVEFHERHPNALVFDRVSDMIYGVDAAIIATPPETHCDIAVFLLAHGIHVLCEKPLAKTVEEAERMRNIARASDSVLYTGHTFLHSTPLLHAIGEAHKIGANELHLTWGQNGTKSDEKDPLWNLGPHPLSIVGQYVGWQDKPGIEVFPGNSFRLDFETLVTANINVSHEWSGEKVRLVDFWNWDEVNYVSCEPLRDEYVVKKQDVIHRESFDLYDDEQPLDRELDCFFWSIEYDHPQRKDGSEGLWVTRILKEVEHLRDLAYG